MKKRVVSVFMIIIMLASVPTIPLNAATNDYTQWKQTDPMWASATPWPNASIPTFGKAGCWITSVAILLRHYNVVTESNVNKFNPLICNNRLMDYGIINSAGDFCNLDRLKNAYPGFEYVGQAAYSGTKLQSLYDQGYACIVHETRGHYVAVRSVSGGVAVVMDPGYNTTSLTQSDTIQYFKVPKRDTTKPKITNAKISNLTSKGYTVTCNVSDNVGVTQVKFPTWTCFSADSKEQDDLVWHVGTISNGKATYKVKISEHNNEVDINYVTHIYAYDAAGNTASVALGGVLVPGYTEAEKNAFKPSVTGTYGQNRYEIYDKSLTWKDAKAFCKKKGGHLATITSQGENDAILKLAKGGSKSYYAIGAESENTQGKWRWVNGEAFTYSNWDPQATEGNTKGEPYAFIISIENKPNKQSGEWVDGPNRYVQNNYYHYKNSGFICEYEVQQNSSKKQETTPIIKKANPIKLNFYKKSLKRRKLKKKKTIRIQVLQAEGEVSFKRNKAAKKAKINVTNDGKIKIPKKCKKGKYKITVTAGGNEAYYGGSKTITIIVK